MTSSAEDREFESEPLLDACLEEVLGGQRPPDLKDRILGRWEALQAAESEGGSGDESDAAFPATPLPAVSVSVGELARGRTANSRRFPFWVLAAAAGIVGILVTLWGVRVVQPGRELNPSVADSSKPRPEAPVDPRDSTPDPARPADSAPDMQPSDDGSATDAEPGRAAMDNATDGPEGNSALPETRREPPPTERTELAKLSAEAILAQINTQLAASWATAQIAPAPAASDAQWCERLYEHLLGRGPRPQEARDFVRDASPNKRIALVDRLLGKEYTDEFAAHWAATWADWLLNNSSQRVTNLRIYQVGLQQYLTEVIARESGYDDIMQSLLTATGSNEPRQPDHNPATNYLLALDDEQGVEAAAQVCRVMLGQRMQCAQCHDDPLSETPQAGFWRLAAVFQPLQTEVLRPGRGRLFDDAASAKAPIRYQQRDGTWQSIEPGLLDGEPLDWTATVAPRHELAQQLVRSPLFSRAAVNRIWGSFLRYGFTMPVDDMGRFNPMSHPELVDLLAEQFTAHDYDLRQLMRWIVLSEAFDRSDVITSANSKDFPDGGSIAYFSRYYHRPMLFGRADDGLAWLARGRVPQVTSVELEGDRQTINARRNLSFEGPNPANPSGLIEAASPMGQLLPISHLRVVRSLTARDTLDPKAQVEHAFRIVLARQPTATELARTDEIYRVAEGNQVVALERIFWALLNTGRL